MAEYRTICWQCHAEIVLPFEPRTGKLCDRCYIRPRPKPVARRIIPGDVDTGVVARVIPAEDRIEVRF